MASVTQWRLGLCHCFPLSFRKRTVNKEIEKRGNNKEIVYIRPSRLSSNPYTGYTLTHTHTHTLVKYNYSIHYITKQSRAYPTYIPPPLFLIYINYSISSGTYIKFIFTFFIVL